MYLSELLIKRKIRKINPFVSECKNFDGFEIELIQNNQGDTFLFTKQSPTLSTDKSYQTISSFKIRLCNWLNEYNIGLTEEVNLYWILDNGRIVKYNRWLDFIEIKTFKRVLIEIKLLISEI